MSVIRQRKMRLKTRSIIISITFAIIIIVSLFLILSLGFATKPKVDNMEEKEEYEVIQEEVRKEETNLLPSDSVSDDLRLHYYNNIKLSNKISIGDYIDVRISYGNGMDFIILPKKKVIDASISNNNQENAIWLEVSEEEILRMSSAIVDLNHHEGSLLYAIKYLSDTQNIAKANYPVSDEVRKLIDTDPNIIDMGINLVESMLRKVIDELDYLPDALGEDAVTWGESGNDSTSENDYNKDIEYLD